MALPDFPELINPVIARMRAGEVALGMLVRLSRSGDVVRIAKATGHDFIFIDAQHSLFSLETVGHIGYHDYEGPAVDLDERARLVADLGPHDAMIMRNHGLLTCGATIQQAFNTMYQLELSCRSQVDAMAARTELNLPGENVLAHTAHLYQPGTRRPYGVLEWPAMLRLLEAESRNSGYPPYWN